MGKKNITVKQEDILKALDICYRYAKDGIKNVSPPVSKMADDYLKRNKDVKKAVKSMLNYQVAKCTTSGFITGFGGLITLPVAIPANIGSVLYVQIRMIACTAYMAGMDLNSDQVQTLVYTCLAGISANEILKDFGIKFSQKIVTKGIERIEGKTLTKINQKVGFRLFTKFGEKGLINLGKTVPVVGAVVNGGFDLVETKIIANRAYKMFIDGNEKLESEWEDDDIIDGSYNPDDIIEEDTLPSSTISSTKKRTDLKETSKYISLILRHKPETIGISLDEHGWADVSELIEGIAKTHDLNMDILEEIVSTDEKQRYSFNEDKTKIRANQGHSVQVDVELEEKEPPEILWHGTGEKFVSSIDEQGLIPKSRLYVHLSIDEETATKVGKRHGKPVLYIVETAKMYKDGYKFYLSKNNVWLTKEVPVKYLKKQEK